MRVFYYCIFFFFYTVQAQESLEIQGHRGARGLAPENTLPSFIKAIEHQAHTLEMDVVITRDKQVLVSHDLWIKKEICLDKDGKEFKKDKIFQNRIYRMPYEEVQKYDCGSLFQANFPKQKLIAIHKPLLSNLIRDIQLYLSENNIPQVKYNIEIKSSTKSRGLFHPKPKKFVDLVVKTIEEVGVLEYANIQSFDKKVLQYLHKSYPEIPISLLIKNNKTVAKNIKRLGFIPEAYSPRYDLLSKDDITYLYQLGIRVIPWTVNSTEEMKTLIDMGVDGIITDYPNLAKQLLP